MMLQTVSGAIIGVVLGLGWYKLVGCSAGACPLTSNPVRSTLYGMVVGALVATRFH